MDRPRPVAERHIFLADDKGAMFVWSCSHCYWTTPFKVPDGTAASPIEALKLFNLHRCEEFSEREPGRERLLSPKHEGLTADLRQCLTATAAPAFAQRRVGERIEGQLLLGFLRKT